MVRKSDDEDSKLYIWFAFIGAATGIGLAEDGKWIPCALAVVFAIASITWPRWGR